MTVNYITKLAQSQSEINCPTTDIQKLKFVLTGKIIIEIDLSFKHFCNSYF